MSMLTINEIQDEIIEEFSDLDDWMDRYQLLIDMGGETEPLPDSDKVEQNLIDGCQSRVWLVCDEKEGRLYSSVCFRGTLPTRYWTPTCTSSRR